MVLAMHRAFPDATIYTTLYEPESTYPEFREARIVTSPLNKVRFLRRNHRLALPLLPIAASLFSVRADVIVVSSTGWAHGFDLRGKTLVYCHSPARWLYLTRQYLGGPAWRSPVGWALTALKPFLLRWDQRAARRADKYLVNSTVVQQRVKDVYGWDVDIVHPPHSVDTSGETRPIAGLEGFVGEGGHFLVVSRLLPYKNVDKAIEAFRSLEKRLLVIGAGPLAEKLEKLGAPNVRIASNVSEAELRWAYKHCAAVLAPSYEDFGITPLEAGAWGKPTIALREGGYLDTIRERTTGRFIPEPTSEAIRDAVLSFSSGDWSSSEIKRHVENFSEERFRGRLQAEIKRLITSV